MPHIGKCFGDLTWLDCNNYIIEGLKESNLLAYYTSSFTDDVFVGSHNGVQFEIAESKHTKTSRDRDGKRVTETVFNGVIIRCAMNKNFTGNTIIVPDSLLHISPKFKLKRTTLEDVNFEKKYDEALQAFEAYLKDHPKNEEVWSRMGKIYYTQGNIEKAQDALSHALALQPALNEALYISTLMYIDLKRYPEALQTAGKMLAENKFSVYAWYLQALTYYHMKNYQASINSLNSLLAFRPNYDQAHALAGDIFRDHGDYRKALQMYETALKYAKSGTTYVKIADMLVRLKQYQQANILLGQLEKMEAFRFPVLKIKCRQALQEQQWQAAAEYLSAMENVEDDSELFVLRALCAEGQKDEKSASEMLRRALEVDSGNLEALKMKNRK